MNDSRQYCTFHVDQLYLGIAVQHVQEVIRFQATTRVPLASNVIGGLINLRGQIVTAIDLRARLGLPARATNVSPMNVVIRDAESIVSLLVDRIGDVLEVDEDSFELPPPTVRANVRNLIEGAYKLPGRLLLVLDTARMLADYDVRAEEVALAS